MVRKTEHTDSAAINLFYSYALEDEDLCLKLAKHLSGLRRQGIISELYSRQILPGSDVMPSIDILINTATIVLIFISPDFIASDYCYNFEMKRALERHQAGEARVILVLLRPVDLNELPIANLQCLPRNKVAITSWSNQDEVLRDIATEIRLLIKPQTEVEPSIPSPSPTRHTSYPTINTHEVIKLFRNLMQPESNLRVLQLTGDAKMGKSHLLTKVFPLLTRQEYNARYAIIDLRDSMQPIREVLHLACCQLGKSTPLCSDCYLTRNNFSFYEKLRRDLFPPFSTKDTAVLSLSQITLAFANDLKKQTDHLVLLLFDSVDNASPFVQKWLMNSLLPQISSLDHLRVVLAGRSLPEVSGSYAACCQYYRLKPITEVEEYIEYCQAIELVLQEQSIRDLVHAFDYAPGLFVDVLPKFQQRRTPNG